MASEWYDYKEYKDYLYMLWKKGEWNNLSRDIQRFLWNEKQKLYGGANADMEFGGIDETTLYDLQPNDDGDKKPRKKRKKGNYLRAYSIEQAMEDGIDYSCPFTPEEYVVKSEQYEERYAAITTLDDFDRSIIEMYYFMNMKEQQIGQELDIVRWDVNNHKRSSLKKMRRILTEKQ
ncbi:sigma-70 family RNA polymerase sigma factor [Petralouisia muris]|uniref:Sigma-70 family RNA polymerase sigma factor n=1 Tax=Petralouisia muris TaxID=3032872 RepID=A0AC61RQB3_9FIRM|nr:sigma-70 family RNA polymerase sigma factor [Petralouisia muris]TGY91209.1 sigma-70 family RNA polymerase sigma factor [Petralouisia muris]